MAPLEIRGHSFFNPHRDNGSILPQLIRDEIRDGKTDKYKKLDDKFGETVLYTPKLDLQTAALWLSPLLLAGIAAGAWAYRTHRQDTNAHVVALDLVKGVPLTPTEKQIMLELLTPPPLRAFPSSWWSKVRCGYGF
ncbi:hypothetical protein Nepgr_021003 [Nepenthes gracilis]|uniref:Cytochrome c-type biogenesis protein n=1 Tax=Nepenthes gracilis TaxID=150966 RepID=A0AAD3SY14_NEPGR|nr:hypothetical protein Nepgr_021003 [Nepenthes gracilis]